MFVFKRKLGNKKLISIVNSQLPNKLITQLPYWACLVQIIQELLCKQSIRCSTISLQKLR